MALVAEQSQLEMHKKMGMPSFRVKIDLNTQSFHFMRSPRYPWRLANELAEKNKNPFVYVEFDPE